MILREDFNLDGVEDSKDANLVNVGQTLGWNALSRANNTTGAYNGNRKSYAGYESSFFDHSTMHVRHRIYLAEMGRWSRRDPIGFQGGMNVYAYSNNMPIRDVDPSGLIGCNCVCAEMNHACCYSGCAGGGSPPPEEGGIDPGPGGDGPPKPGGGGPPSGGGPPPPAPPPPPPCEKKVTLSGGEYPDEEVDVCDPTTKILWAFEGAGGTTGLPFTAPHLKNAILNNPQLAAFTIRYYSDAGWPGAARQAQMVWSEAQDCPCGPVKPKMVAVGYSWGGSAMQSFAKRLHRGRGGPDHPWNNTKVDLAATAYIDPVRKFFHSEFEKLPNVTACRNYYQTDDRGLFVGSKVRGCTNILVTPTPGFSRPHVQIIFDEGPSVANWLQSL